MTATLPDKWSERLKAAMASQLLDIFENGMPVTDKDDKPVLNQEGQPIRVPPPAAFFNAAIKLLPIIRGTPGSGDADDGSLAAELEAIGRQAAAKN